MTKFIDVYYYAVNYCYFRITLTFLKKDSILGHAAIFDILTTGSKSNVIYLRSKDK